MSSANVDEFLFPQCLVRSAGAAARVGELLRSSGVPKGPVLIVADRVVHSMGLSARLLAGLSAAGYAPTIFDDVAGEPRHPEVQAGAQLAEDTDAVAIIGLGGGSALDTAKLVAYSSASGAPIRELKGALPAIDGFPRLVLIPTTVGTGSEATRVAMFTVEGAKRAVTSTQFVPYLAILDSDLVSGLPQAVIASTAMDALSHALETMLSTTSNDLTWEFSVKAARMVLSRLPAAVEEDREAVADLQYAAFLAGVSLNAGVVLGHSMSYVVSARHGLSHGAGCALALPYCLVYNRTMNRQTSSAIAEATLEREGVGLLDLALTVEKLSQSLGLATNLSQLGTKDAEIPELADKIVTEFPRPNNPVELSTTRVSGLLSHMQPGNLQGAWDDAEAI